jgi:hypothetical protein
MFGFLKKRLLREHSKLVAQNFLALPYIEGYYQKKPEILQIENCAEILRNIMKNWHYGQKLDKEQFQLMIDTNRLFRRLYNNSIGSSLKSFDDEFRPILGWSEFFEYRNI